MVIVGYLFLLLVIAMASFSGPLYLLFAGSSIRRYVVELSIVFLPAVVVVSLSAAGYIRAANGHASWLIPLLASGALTTAYVLFRERAHLQAAASAHGSRILVVLLAALAAGLVAIPRQLAQNEFGYLEFMNGEFLNYSQLAAYTIGLQHSDVPVTFLKWHQTLRDGIDFINLAICSLVNRNPVHVVQCTSAYLRITAFVLPALIVWELRPRDRFGAWTAIFLLLGAAAFALDVYAYQVSFMASNAATGVFVLLLVMLFVSDRLPWTAFLVLYVIGNLHLLITYSEIAPFLKIVEAVIWAEAWRKSGHLRWSLPLGNLIVVCLNPPLIARKISYVLNLQDNRGGWSFLSSPVDTAAQYFRRISGLEYNFIPTPLPLGPAASLALALLIFAFGLWGLHRLAARLHTRSVWLLPLGAAWFHLAPLTIPFPAGIPTHFYGAGKFILAWLWVAPIAFGVAGASLQTRLSRGLFATAVTVCGTINLVVLVDAIRFQLRLPTFYSEADANTVVATVRATGKPVAILSEQPVPLWYWFQVLDSGRLSPLILTQSQANTIARAPSAGFAPPTPQQLGSAIIGIKPTKVIWMNNYNAVEQPADADKFLSGMTQFGPAPGPALLSGPLATVEDLTVVRVAVSHD